MTLTLRQLLLLTTVILFLLSVLPIVQLTQQNHNKLKYREGQKMEAQNSELKFVRAIGCILAVILVFGCSSWFGVATSHGMPHIDATARFDQPPEWAVLQRELINQMNTSVDVFIEKYLADDGSFRYDCWGETGRFLRNIP